MMNSRRFTSNLSRTSKRKIARRETYCTAGFPSTLCRYGSFASHRCARNVCGMSATPPIATQLARGNVPSRCGSRVGSFDHLICDSLWALLLLHRPLGGFGLSFHAVEATCPAMSAIAPIATGSPRSRNMTRSANIRHRASVLMLVQRSVAYLSLLNVATRRPGWFRCLASHSARAPADGSTGLANGGSGHASASDHCPTYAASEANLRDHAVRLRSRRRRYCVRRSCDG